MLKSAGLLMGLLMVGSAANASVVTFTGVGSTEFGWTEDGITIDPTFGGAFPFHHFHGFSPGEAGTFTSDGIPVRITAGGVFDLTSIEFISFSSGAFATFTSSAGGLANISTAGVFDFTSVTGFSGVTFVDFTLNIPATSEYLMVWDNVNANLGGTVPEPTTLLLLGAGLSGMVARRRRAALRQSRGD